MITPRLRCIVDCVSADTVADVGCDHAYVPIALIDEGRAKNVIATDINKGPVLIADENIKKHNKTGFIQTRIGGGLTPIDEGEVDTIIIAGMGGELICAILREDIKKALGCTLVLQPMNAQHEVREFLLQNGFGIINEDIATEGFKVYNIIVAKKGSGKAFGKKIHYHIPPYLKNHKHYKALFDKKKREFTKIITGLEKSQNPDMEKLNEYRRLLEELIDENK